VSTLVGPVLVDEETSVMEDGDVTGDMESDYGQKSNRGSRKHHLGFVEEDSFSDD